MSFGIALMVQGRLGISPISSFPYVFSVRFPQISLGTFTMILNLLLITGQILILRREFTLIQFVQFPITLLFGLFVDVSKWMLSVILPQAYWQQLLVFLFGCVVLALGVSLAVTAGVVMNSGEAFIAAVSRKSGLNFGTVKVLFDVTLVLLAILFSFLFMGRLEGVREGTVIAALLSGFIIRFFNRIMKPPFERWFAGKSSRAACGGQEE